MQKETGRWIIGIAVTLIIGFFSIWLTYLNINKKSLEYSLVSKYRLSPQFELPKDKIKILFQDIPVDTLDAITIDIINNGNSPVRKDDFEDDIKMTFSNNSRILDAKVSLTTPQNLQTRISFEKNQVFLKPLLLNSSDLLRIQILVSGNKTYPEISSRIAGIQSITERNNELVVYSTTPQGLWFCMICAILLFVFGAIFLSFLFLPYNTKIVFSKIELIVLFFISILSGWNLFGFCSERINFLLPIWANWGILLVGFSLIVVISLKIYKKRLGIN